jgi:hypothetical protein
MTSGSTNMLAQHSAHLPQQLPAVRFKRVNSTAHLIKNTLGVS